MSPARSFAGLVPTEMNGLTEFPRIAEQPYFRSELDVRLINYAGFRRRLVAPRAQARDGGRRQPADHKPRRQTNRHADGCPPLSRVGIRPVGLGVAHVAVAVQLDGMPRGAHGRHQLGVLAHAGGDDEEGGAQRRAAQRGKDSGRPDGIGPVFERQLERPCQRRSHHTRRFPLGSRLKRGPRASRRAGRPAAGG